MTDYEVTLAGRTVALPALTVSTQETLDTLKSLQASNISVGLKAERTANILRNLIGSDIFIEIFDKDVKNIDLNKLHLAAKAIIDTYEEPARAYESERLANLLSTLHAEKIEGVAQAINRLQG